MKPQDALDMAESILESLGLGNWQISIASNLVSDAGKPAHGLCGDDRTIKLNRKSVLRFSWPAIKDLVLHEAAHAIDLERNGGKWRDDEHGHDDIWKAICLEIGASPMRYTNYDIYEIE